MSTITNILSKLLGETLLSFYPIIVKKINLDLILQLWSRYFSYVIFSAFFIDWGFVYKSIRSFDGLMLSVITLIHVYTSYRSFQLLDSGIATTIFYLYPIIILLLSGTYFSPIIFVSLFGVYLIANDINGSSQSDNTNSENTNAELDELLHKYGANGRANIFKDGKNLKEHYWNEGIITALLAAFTEAVIFYLIRNIKTNNNWNHLFLSYFIGAIVLTFFLWEKISKTTLYSGMSLSLGLNSFIGLIGYYLRFYSISRLDTYTYAILSYFGIVMSYIYGVVLNNEVITLQKLFGTLCIISANIYTIFR